MKLTERQKKFLRSRAHDLKPTINVGDKGITPALLKELDTTLTHHELIKIKVRAGDRDARDELIEELVTKAKATLIRRVGNIATVYRPRKKDSAIKLPEAQT